MAHIVGEAHKASKEKWRRVPNTCPLLYAKIQPHKLSTVKLWCMPCQKELFNIAHAFHHIDQAPHHPNTSVDFITSIGNGVYNCTICLLTLHGENDLNLHYRSPKHRDNKQEANTIKSATKKPINKEFQQKNEQQKNNETPPVPLLSLPYRPVNGFPPYRFPGPPQPYNGPQHQVPYLLQQPNLNLHPRGPNPYNAPQPYNAPHPNQFLVLNHPVDNYNYAAGTVTGDTRAPGHNHSARNDFNHGGNNRHNVDHAYNNGNRRPHPNRRGNHQNNNQRRNLDKFTQRINMSERQIDEDDFKGKDTGRNQKGTDVKKPQTAAKKTPVEAAKPVVQTIKSAAQTIKSAEQTNKSAAQTIKSAAQTIKPVAQATKPVAQPMKPTSDVTIPRQLNQDANKVAAKVAADKKAHKAAVAAKAAAMNRKKMKAIEQQKRDSQNGNMKLRNP